MKYHKSSRDSYINVECSYLVCSMTLFYEHWAEEHLMPHLSTLFTSTWIVSLQPNGWPIELSLKLFRCTRCSRCCQCIHHIYDHFIWFVASRDVNFIFRYISFVVSRFLDTHRHIQHSTQMRTRHLHFCHKQTNSHFVLRIRCGRRFHFVWCDLSGCNSAINYVERLQLSQPTSAKFQTNRNIRQMNFHVSHKPKLSDMFVARSCFRIVSQQSWCLSTHFRMYANKWCTYVCVCVSCRGVAEPNCVAHVRQTVPYVIEIIF